MMKDKITVTIKIPPRESKELTSIEKLQLVEFFLLLVEMAKDQNYEE